MPREVPYCSWLYEVNRDCEIDRHAWVDQIYSEAAVEGEVTPRGVSSAIRYARKLAVTDGQYAPTLNDLVTAADCCVNAAYADAVRTKALSFPPAKNR